MRLIVQKFGGTSVATPERIQAVARRIAKARAQGNSLVVVVSAMGQTTDELLALAHQVSEQPLAREMDMLLSSGERISMSLLSMALSDLGVPAVSLTGSQTGIITDCSHRRARIQKILGSRVRAALDQGHVAIVAGFQGVSEAKDVTTLGRGGSDTTAVALAAVLGAEICEIYTDVDGVFSADPRQAPAAQLWSSLPYEMMLELAYRGAGVLHPRSVELAKKFNVQVRVKNSLRDENDLSEGTLIMNSKSELGTAKESMERFQFVGVTADTDRMPLCVHLARAGVVGAVLDHATRSGLTVMCPLFQDGKVWFYIERSSQVDWKRSLDQLVIQEFVKQYEFMSEYVPISLVGECLSQDGTVFCRVLETLSKEGVPVILGMTSAIAFTGAIPQLKVQEAVAALHAEFFEKG